MSDLAELLKIAEAATPGPWYFSFSDNATPHILTKDVDLRSEYDDTEVVKILVHTVPDTLGKQYENGIFAAAFNPTVAKALVRVAMAAKTQHAYAKWQIAEGGAHHPTLASATGATGEALSALTLALKGSDHGQTD